MPSTTLRKKERVPISGRNDPLAVEGKDPNYYYRWVHDQSEKGTNILKYQRAGYEFATKDEGLVIGAASVYINDHVGSHIRVPSGKDGGNMYLMKQPGSFTSYNSVPGQKKPSVALPHLK